MPNYQYRDKQIKIEITPQGEGVSLILENGSYEARLIHLYHHEYLVHLNQAFYPISIVRDQDNLWLGFEGHSYQFTRERKNQSGDQKAGAGNTIEAPMTGKILEVLSEVGQEVEQNQPLAILEAMKMETNLMAPCSGVIKQLLCTEGQQVELGQLLIEIEPTS